MLMPMPTPAQSFIIREYKHSRYNYSLASEIARAGDFSSVKPIIKNNGTIKITTFNVNHFNYFM